MSAIVKEDDIELLELKARLWGSFLLFAETFYPLVTGRPFSISRPTCRESHFITIAKELTLVSRLDTQSLCVNVPPGSGKSTLISLFCAWQMSRWPDSQFLYISYGFELAAKHTEFIRRIIQTPHYQSLFGVHIRYDMKAKDHFVTNHNGSVKAFGMGGPIVGQDAGLPNVDHRFSGAIIMDDLHKPDEVHSDTMRDHVIKNYRETILQRPRSPKVPMIYIGQRLHEADLCSYLLSGQDERQWKPLILKAVDEAGNALYPEVNPLDQLMEKKEKNPYVFSSQYQQEPIPAGGALYKERDFVILDQEPEFLCTFITADTAETSKTYNDASAFSFWGLYRLETGNLALHWLDCWELRVEPKELEFSFKSFWAECMLHKTKPLIAAIEKKSTGVTLCSVLEDIRGLEVREVKRTKASGSKTERYLEMQPILSAKLISFTYGAKHVRPCIQHMLKITANDSHRHDDICDTVYDAIKIALIDKTLYYADVRQAQHRNLKQISTNLNDRLSAIKGARGY